jgi:uncharacterized membrane protein YfcA
MIWGSVIMLKWQIGQFLILVGVIGLIVFFVTDQQKSPDYLYFCSGILIIFFGGYVMWQGRNPPQPSQRFRFLRGRAEKRDEKEKK